VLSTLALYTGGLEFKVEATFYEMVQA